MRFLMYGLIATALVLMLCISGCTSPAPTQTPTTLPATPPPTTQPTLTGVTWYLIAFDQLAEQLGPGSPSVLPGTTITAFFDAQGTVSGSAGCNQYTAPYRATLNGLFVGTPANTMMYCDQPAGIMTQESLYLTKIQSGTGYAISGTTLTVTDSGGRAILTYSTVPPHQRTPAPLIGTMWYLIAFNQGAGSLSVLPGTTITAVFDAQGTVSGSAGCNQYTAPYQATLNGLFVGAAASTMMFCDQPTGIMSQETLYLTTLQGGMGYTLTGNLLTVTDSGGRPLLTFSTEPPHEMTPAPLTGTMWFLNSLVDVQGQIWSPRTGNPISLQFGTDGVVSGNGGCNRYSGTYTASGNTISISGFAVTAMFCGEPGVMDIESTYLAILPMMKVFRITGNELILSDGTGRITMIFDITT